jgi:prepilin-type N-terminal cleavage/methylation domain-containing protein
MTRKMREGFTLIELMLVVGIMAFLGVAATNGYNALQRGMAERGATAVASAVLKAAKERASVDRVPTIVYCYNRMIREATETDSAVVAGEIVAVRRAGRITKVAGQKLYDEFADLASSYDSVDDVSDAQERRGMRLWRFDGQQVSDMKYSIVADAVIRDVGGVQLQSFAGWGDLNNAAGGSVSNYTDFVTYAFYNKQSSNFEPSSWTVGSGYGFEFQTVQLPHGFIFGTAVPAVGQVSFVKAVYFDPENPSDGSVEVYRCQSGSGGGLTTSGSAVGQASSDGKSI